MKKYVCLRDDDTCYFTKKEELIEGYKGIWGRIPITLGVVPFSHGSQMKMLEFENEKDRIKALRKWEEAASASELTEYHKLHPIGDNSSLINELRELQCIGKIEIAQHGVSHRYNEYGAETRINQLTLPMIKDGKEYLEKVFLNEIKTYIPPSNTIDSICANYVNLLGMVLFSSGTIIYNKTISKIFSVPPYLYESIRIGRNKPIRKRNGQYIISSFTFGTYRSKEQLYDLIVDSLKETGFAAIGTHYMSLYANKAMREDYINLIQRIRDDTGVEFVTATDYYHLLKDKYYSR